MTTRYLAAPFVAWLAISCAACRPHPAPAPTDTAPAAADSSSSPAPSSPSAHADYRSARSGFRTRLLREGPSPQQDGPLTTPPGAKVIAYRSGDLPLKAFVDPPPADGKKHRALVFCHGGFSFGADDWTMPQPFRDAGFVVMVPILRGENGQPGSFSTFYYEVDDVLAAADALTTLPYVDPKQVFISGHSAGGTLTLLAAMASPRFRGAASLSASVDQAAFAEGRPELVAYDPSSDAEVEMRSPLAFSTSLRSPTRMYYGNLERWAAWPTAKLAHGAKEARLDVESVEVPGDHFTSVPPGIREAIRFFDGL